jgi:hypothetical protein
LSDTDYNHLVSFWFLTGFALLLIGTIGVVAGLVGQSALSVFLAVASVVGGCMVLRAGQRISLDPETRHANTVASQAAYYLSLTVTQICTLLMGIVYSVLGVLTCLVAGAGAGLLTTGIFAIRQPELWEYEFVWRNGPPFAPVMIGAGVGLLTTEVLLLALFFRGRSRRLPSPADKKTGPEVQGSSIR